jgi:hypothetical protein
MGPRRVPELPDISPGGAGGLKGRCQPARQIEVGLTEPDGGDLDGTMAVAPVDARPGVQRSGWQDGDLVRDEVEEPQPVHEAERLAVMLPEVELNIDAGGGILVRQGEKGEDSVQPQTCMRRDRENDGVRA